MNLSTVGRVVIIDDVYKETQPLLEVLGKHQIPYLYLDGKAEHLPDSPFSGIRFVFMDIELSGGFAGQDVKTKASGITAILEKIISKQNGPYVIIAWTKHTEVIKQVVENCRTLNIHPVQTLDLEKTECLKSNDVISYLTQKLSDVLQETGAFQLYVDWENMLNVSAKDFILKFSSFYPVDNKWSRNTENLFYKLYKSYVEKNELIDKDEQIRCSLHLLNRSYLDALENVTSTYVRSKNFQLTGGRIDKEIIAKLNLSLFMISNPNIPKSPGSIYEETNNNLLKHLKQTCFKRISTSPKNFRLCKMIITPECDIAQNKLTMNRLVYGVFFKAHSEIQPKDSQDIFRIGPFWFKGEIYQIILSFQSITSSFPENINDKKRLFAVRRDLLFDIQSKAANHVNRLGNYQLES